MDKNTKTPAGDPAPDAGGASQEKPYEGEVIGYELSSLMQSAFEELQKAQENHHLSPKTAFLAGTALKDLYGHLASQGITTIQLPEQL